MMTLHAHRRPSALPMLAVVTLLVSACEAACVQPPCSLPIAVTVTVTSSVTGDSVPGAFVQMNAQSDPEPCTMSPGTTCNVGGDAGTYDLTIGAPGYQTAHRTVDVPVGQAATCGCSVPKTQHLDVTLAPVG